MFTIGEISKLFQIDIRTLRYYDDIDLFKPATVDHLTSYRYYSVDQFEQLNTILYLKALGIPLKDIKLFLDDREIDHILTLLKEQQRRTEEKIEEYQRIQSKIKSRIEQIEDASNKEELYKIREVEFPERVMVLLKQNIHKSDNLDMPIRLLENSTKMKSTIFLGKVGLSISINRLMHVNLMNMTPFLSLWSRKVRAAALRSKRRDGRKAPTSRFGLQGHTKMQPLITEISWIISRKKDTT
ncbi:helix-turn-helix domain-containing protein [Paenibacillus lautus]|nr:helix-turn-helix domain-containing protein [Paenibacillus lautus]MEC0201477.1 helix-turn-helix domain-containing protein [Paenibacillus lautus]